MHVYLYTLGVNSSKAMTRAHLFFNTPPMPTVQLTHKMLSSGENLKAVFSGSQWNSLETAGESTFFLEAPSFRAHPQLTCRNPP